MELYGTFPWMSLHYFLQMREEISGQLSKSTSCRFYGIFQIFPGSMQAKEPSHAISETKKV